MSSVDEELLIAQAVKGSAESLQGLLLRHYDRLLGFIRAKLPADIRRVTDPEDVLQETCIEAFKRIGAFEAQGADSFFRWLATIARHRMLDLIAAHRAAKRGGRVVVIGQDQPVRAKDASLSALLEHLTVGDPPHRRATRREAHAALHVAMAALKEDTRKAITMRYLEHQPVPSIAQTLRRTDRAIHQLCNRGLRQLEAALGRASQYLSSSSH
ncbi:MAG: RNA polymerase sigma factor [Phycisphaeraceae bacterium]